MKIVMERDDVEKVILNVFNKLDKAVVKPDFDWFVNNVCRDLGVDANE